MSRRVEIQGARYGLLAELAESVVQEMCAEGYVGLRFDIQSARFIYQGDEDYYRQEVTEAEKRYGLKLQKLREEQVVANAKKCGYTPKKRVEEGGEVKIVLRRRVYG